MHQLFYDYTKQNSSEYTVDIDKELKKLKLNFEGLMDRLSNPRHNKELVDEIISDINFVLSDSMGKLINR